jgi:hypothetical protein
VGSQDGAGLSKNLLGEDPAAVFGLIFYVVYSILDDNDDSNGIILLTYYIDPAVVQESHCRFDSITGWWRSWLA